MDNRVALDRETDLPLGRLVPCPFNPKAPVSGAYRRGLEGSIDHFGLRDRLHVWRDPSQPSHYMVLDGNQRLAAVSDMILDSLARAHFQLDPDVPAVKLAALMEDPAHTKAIQKLRAQSLKTPVPVQILEKFDATTPFTLAHAKAFVAIWNRNHAKYDEIKQADLYREVRAELLARASQSTDIQRSILESRLKTMFRPELPLTPPASSAGGASVSPGGAPSTPPQAFTFAEPGTFTPTAAEPWGPPPPSTPAEAPRARASFIPLVFSLTEDGYNAITQGVLRSKARAFKESRLIDALSRLQTLMDSAEYEKAVESAVVEVALTIFNKRFEAAS